jgi:hypothetical protein
MAGNSTLDPDNFPDRPERGVRRGHGTGALGPSDSSDTGSDISGGRGMAQEAGLDLGSGTTSDLEQSTAKGTAGPDVGDADLDSDSDASGTGERATAGRDTVSRSGGDIDTDHVDTMHDEMLDDDDVRFLSSRPPGERQRKGRGPARPQRH